MPSRSADRTRASMSSRMAGSLIAGSDTRGCLRRVTTGQALVNDGDPVVDVGDARRGPGDGDGVIVLGPGADRPRKDDQAGKWAVGRYIEPVQPGAAPEGGADRLLDVVVARGLPGRDAGQGDEARLDAGLHGRGDVVVQRQGLPDVGPNVGIGPPVLVRDVHLDEVEDGSDPVDVPGGVIRLAFLPEAGDCAVQGDPAALNGHGDSRAVHPGIPAQFRGDLCSQPVVRHSFHPRLLPASWPSGPTPADATDWAPCSNPENSQPARMRRWRIAAAGVRLVVTGGRGFRPGRAAAWRGIW